MKSKSSVTFILLAGLVLIAVVPLLAAGCTSVSSASNNSKSSPTTAGASFSLVVSQPQDNSITDSDRIEVKGRTNPGATVSIKEEMAIADEEGNFVITVALDEGLNIIEVFSSDEAKNEAEVTLIVTLVKGG